MGTKAKKCPACGWEITDAGKQVKIDDRVVLVCCEECAEKVKSDPDKYLRAT